MGCPRPPQKQEATRLGKEAEPGPGRNWAALLEPREAGRLPAFAAVTSAVFPAARPTIGGLRRVPARPPPGVGTPFLLSRPSSASSVSLGKAVASFGAPHPRLGKTPSCFRHPSPVSSVSTSVHLGPREQRALHRLCRGQVSRSPAEGCWLLRLGLRGPRSPQRGLSGLAVPTHTESEPRTKRLSSRITPPP